MAPCWVTRHRDPSTAQLGHGVPSPGTPAPLGWQCPQHGAMAESTARLGHRVPGTVLSTMLWHGVTSTGSPAPPAGRSVPAQHPARCHIRVPSHATAWAQCPRHRLPAVRSSALSSSLRPPPLGCGVPSTVPRHAVPNPCPVSPWPRVPLTAANLVGAVGAIGLLVAVVAGGDAGPAGYAAELVWPTRRAGRLGGYKGQQPSAGAMSPRVPTAPSHTHGSRSHLSRPRSRCPHRSATASGRSAHCGT